MYFESFSTAHKCRKWCVFIIAMPIDHAHCRPNEVFCSCAQFALVEIIRCIILQLSNHLRAEDHDINMIECSMDAKRVWGMCCIEL